MKVTANQSTTADVKVPTIFCQCRKCYSILKIKKADLLEGADKDGHWFYVRCGACGEETGVPEILANRLE